MGNKKFSVVEAKKLANYIEQNTYNTEQSCRYCYERRYFERSGKEYFYCRKLKGHISMQGICNYFILPPAGRFGIKEAHTLPDFKIYVKFNDDKEGIIDCRDSYIREGILPQYVKQFYDEKVFQSMKVKAPFFLEFLTAATDLEYYDLRKVLGFSDGIESPFL